MAVIFGVKRWLECIWGEDVADTRSADYIQTAGRHRGELIHPDWAGGMGRGLVGEDVDNENRLVRDLWSCVRRFFFLSFFISFSAVVKLLLLLLLLS